MCVYLNKVTDSQGIQCGHAVKTQQSFSSLSHTLIWTCTWINTPFHSIPPSLPWHVQKWGRGERCDTPSERCIVCVRVNGHLSLPSIILQSSWSMRKMKRKRKEWKDCEWWLQSVRWPWARPYVHSHTHTPLKLALCDCCLISHVYVTFILSHASAWKTGTDFILRLLNLGIQMKCTDFT